MQSLSSAFGSLFSRDAGSSDAGGEIEVVYNNQSNIFKWERGTSVAAFESALWSMLHELTGCQLKESIFISKLPGFIERLQPIDIYNKTVSKVYIHFRGSAPAPAPPSVRVQPNAHYSVNPTPNSSLPLLSPSESLGTPPINHVPIFAYGQAFSGNISVAPDDEILRITPVPAVQPRDSAPGGSGALGSVRLLSSHASPNSSQRSVPALLQDELMDGPMPQRPNEPKTPEFASTRTSANDMRKAYPMMDGDDDMPIPRIAEPAKSKSGGLLTSVAESLRQQSQSPGLITVPPPKPAAGRIPNAGANAAGGSQLRYMQLMGANKTNGNQGKGVNKTQFTKEEVAGHSKQTDCWTVLNGKVYDITSYLDFHPGGKAKLMLGAGKDCTDLFNKYHPWVNAPFLLDKAYLGTLKSSLPRLLESPKKERNCEQGGGAGKNFSALDD